MTERVIQKALVSQEDLALGQGQTTQDRQGVAIPVTLLDLPWIVTSLAGLKALNATKIKHAMLEIAAVHKHYTYDATSTATPDDDYVVLPDEQFGRWLRQTDAANTTHSLLQFATVTQMKNGVPLGAAVSPVDFTEYLGQQVLVVADNADTRSSDGWYTIWLISEYRTAIGSPYWEPDGTNAHYLLGTTALVAVSTRLKGSLVAYGVSPSLSSANAALRVVDAGANPDTASSLCLGFRSVQSKFDLDSPAALQLNPLGGPVAIGSSGVTSPEGGLQVYHSDGIRSTQTVAAAQGGLLINNLATGAGEERALTESDLDGVISVSTDQVVQATAYQWLKSASVTGISTPRTGEPFHSETVVTLTVQVILQAYGAGVSHISVDTVLPPEYRPTVAHGMLLVGSDMPTALTTTATLTPGGQLLVSRGSTSSIVADTMLHATILYSV